GGEIFNHLAKGFSNGVVMFVSKMLGFLVVYNFKASIDVFGEWAVYGFFAMICFFGIVFSYFFLPETKGLTLQQIERSLQDGWFQQHRTKLVTSRGMEAGLGAC
ncbi:unnamed protein product, partial [Allacma fusca]